MNEGNKQVQKMHKETSSYVQASAQSKMMRTIQEHLTEEEHGIYKRGRNAKSVSPAKKMCIRDRVLCAVFLYLILSDLIKVEKRNREEKKLEKKD